MVVHNAFCSRDRAAPSRFEPRIPTIRRPVMLFGESFATRFVRAFHLRPALCCSTKAKLNIATRRQAREAGFALSPGVPRRFKLFRTSFVHRCATLRATGLLHLITSETHL